MKKKVATIFGTRPEIIKMAPVIPLFDTAFTHILIYTDQHYSPELSDVFFEELGVRKPDYSLDVHSSDIGKLVEGITPALAEAKPDAVVVYGDTNSSYAGALASEALFPHIPIAHIEAGLRSFDDRMYEERARFQIDKRSALLLTPSKLAKVLLEYDPRITGRKYFTGNTITDALDHFSRFLPRIEEQGYALMTMHRAENVDDPDYFRQNLDHISTIAKRIVYPVHPRAKANIENEGIVVPPNIEIRPPMDYFTFLAHLKNADLILTDSGGVQEEAVYFGKPCITLRNSTERSETLAIGSNKLFDARLHKVGNGALKEAIEAVEGVVAKNTIEYPYGKPGVGGRITMILEGYLNSR
ncbi:UDP-N-acetylglucosamine 2-epimerase (non-hydrolyzing) [Candidatus Woesearchaeota archaeon]|nr:UDP-N-acetylglucosamine 2-epimerase (non-hydrolyzing) [Candidatus Woesearchaeota archaeon]